MKNDDEERGAARSTDPQTSHDAAESVNPKHLYDKIRQVMARAARGETRYEATGLITHQMAHLAEVGYQSISPRMVKMEKKGWVYRTGEKRFWTGCPGRPATNRESEVWQLTGFGPGPPVEENKKPAEPKWSFQIYTPQPQAKKETHEKAPLHAALERPERRTEALRRPLHKSAPLRQKAARTLAPRHRHKAP